MRKFLIAALLQLLVCPSSWAFLGTELGPLLQLVSGQVAEIERLTETVGLAKDQAQYLRELNEGVEQTVFQIESIQSIIDRAQGMDPTAVRSVSDLNDLLSRAKQSKMQIEELLEAKVLIANQAIKSSAVQSDTSYRMGQEMVSTGAHLAHESKSASPGRAAQISAASGSAQMLAQGVELQTLAQIVQLQALTLEFQKTQVEREIRNEGTRRAFYEKQLLVASKKVRP